MDNAQFRKYIEGKVKAIQEEMGQEGTTVPQYMELKKLLELAQDGLRIMTYGTGPARRRFRRNYERILEKQGKQLEDLA